MSCGLSQSHACTSYEERRADDWLPKPKILHPWPNVRFAVKHSRLEPDAGIPPVRVCAGAVSNHRPCRDLEPQDALNRGPDSDVTASRGSQWRRDAARLSMLREQNGEAQGMIWRLRWVLILLPGGYSTAVIGGQGSTDQIR
jgi:hypothetical protein